MSRFFLLIPALVFIFAPLWTPHVQPLAGQNLFLTPDSLVLLGAALLLGVLFEFFLPKRFCPQFNSIKPLVETNATLVTLCFLGILFVGLVLANKYVLKSFMNSADEHSCYFLAECMRKGRLWATPHPLAEFFEAVHIGNKNGKWFSVYPPGWPLLMSVALRFRVLDLLNPVLAVASIAFLYQTGKKLFGSLSTGFGLFLMSLTPFFIFNSASYFSHSACLFTISIFLFSYFKWKENHHVLWATLVALSAGYGLGIRYLSMAAVIAPFLLCAGSRLIFKKERWDKSHAVFITIFVAMWALNLYYNYTVTGNFFDAPNHFHHSWERLGFKKDYTPVTALVFVLARFFYLVDWLPAPFLLFYAASLFNKTAEPLEHKLFRFGFFYLPIGYLFYYSWGGNQYGPRYYFEGIPFLFIVLGERIIAWWKSGTISSKRFMLGVVIVSVVGSFYLLQKQIFYFERVSRERKALYLLAEQTIGKPSLVFIRGFLGDTLVMSQEDAVRNNPQLNSKILYAHDLGQKNSVLKRYYPDRDCYLGIYDRKHKLPKLERILV